MAGGEKLVWGNGGYFGAPCSKIAANSIRNGPPTKKIIAERAANKPNTFSNLPVAKLDMIARSGTTIIPSKKSTKPCITPLKRGDRPFSLSGSGASGSMPPWASRCIVPSMAKPQREQNRIESVACCWPHLGQYIREASAVNRRANYERRLFE